MGGLWNEAWDTPGGLPAPYHRAGSECAPGSLLCGVANEAQCSVCNSPATDRLYELDFCASCFANPAEAPGTQIEVTHEKRDKLDQISVTFVHEVGIKVTLAKSAQVSASFSAERIGQKLIKVFKAELQAGDAAFDDAIYIADEHRESTKKLLENAGARQAILKLVGEKNRVTIEHGNIDFLARDEGRTDVLSYLRAALALSRHIVAVG